MNLRLKGLKKIKLSHAAVMLAVGIAFLAFGNMRFPQKSEDSTEEKDKAETTYSDNAEEKLGEIIGRIKGVSNVSVYITYENDGVKKTDYNIKENVSSNGESESKSRESTAVTESHSSDEEPFVSEETKPQVRGVLIVAEGVGNAELNAQITEAVSVVMGVAVHKVKILPSD